MAERYWWLNEESEQVLNRGYLLKGESPKGAVDRVATAASKRLNRPDLKQKFIDVIEYGWISFSSPMWSNMGTERGLPISCYNIHVPDAVEGITHKLGEVIMQTKIGGGTSGYFGDLRGRGAAITDNGSSSGAVSFMKLYDTAMDVVSQGSTRRGSFAAYLDIDHPDVVEFLKIKDVGHEMQNIFTGVNVPDYWMEDMVNGDMEKRALWAKVLANRQKKGLPYIFFTDNVNINKPEIYKELGATINASNLCVSGDTEVLTHIGYQNIMKLSLDESSDIWNGAEWSNVKVVKTGENKELLRVEVLTGVYLDCTPYHKFYIDINGESTIVEAKDLVVGNKIIEYKLPDSNGYTSWVSNMTIKKVSKLEGLHDTYCFKEEKRGMGVFNGILTGQCSEIALPSSENESFVCCLASLNLELFDEWKDTDTVEVITYLLDAVLSEFIDKTEGNYYLTNARNFAMRHRAIGIGVLGYHSYLQKIGRPFEHPLNIGLNKAIFKKIQDESYAASIKLAKEYGPAPIFDESKNPNIVKMRNTTTMAIAPTTSSSAILGQVSAGIEPFSSNYYKAGLAKGNFVRKNKYLQKLLIEKGINNDSVWRQVMLDQGSVANVDGLTQDEKNLFKTFREISQHDIIEQAAARQEYIDQSQSLNLNIPPEVPVKDVNALLINAWRKKIKTLYYQRSNTISKELLSNIVTCSSCES